VHGSIEASQRRGGEYIMKMPSLKPTILLVGTPALLLVGGLTTMAASAATPMATPSAQTQPAAEPAETADAGGGHADAAGQNVDHQFEGVE
jgi:hypothetical protein